MINRRIELLVGEMLYKQIALIDFISSQKDITTRPKVLFLSKKKRGGEIKPGWKKNKKVSRVSCQTVLGLAAIFSRASKAFKSQSTISVLWERLRLAF